MLPVPHVVQGLKDWIKTAPLGAAWDTEERRADVLSFDPDGKNERTFATGLRNCAGLTIQPEGMRPDLKDKVTIPDVLIQAHSAPLQIIFYEGDSFPAEYKGSAFVTMHGSWNRDHRTGYKVVRLLFDGAGKPTGEYEDFMTSFVVSDEQVWGRPVGVAVAKDGSLFVTEDGNGTIWRVSYQKPGSH